MVGTSGDMLCDNLMLFKAPKLLSLAPSSVKWKIVNDVIDVDDGGVSVRVRAEGGVALFVTLTTLAQGNFDRNAFLLLPSSPVTLTFQPAVRPLNRTLFAASLRAEHAATYASNDFFADGTTDGKDGHPSPLLEIKR